jgi:hypothetical protein
MALLTFEGFEPYATAAQSAQTLNTVENNSSISTAQARTGARSLTTTGVTISNFWRRVFTRTSDTVIVGVAYRFSAFPNDTAAPLCRFGDTVGGVHQIGFGVNASGNLVVGRGITADNLNYSVVLATHGVETEPMGTWVHYEFKALLRADATGAFTLRRNGAIVLAASGVQTISGAGINVNCVTLHTRSNHADDLYVCDGAGAHNNDFLGQVRVATLRPDGNHAVQWTPNAGPNWQAVADVTPDDDTSFVSAATPLTDLYTFTDLPPAAATVRGVMVQHRARMDDAGTVVLRGVLGSGAAEIEGPNDNLDTLYRYASFVAETDPATAAAWTPSAVNGLRAGVRRIP